MPKHVRWGGTAQYQTQAEGVACANYLTQWATDYDAMILTDGENGHVLTELDPPAHEDGDAEYCPWQLDWCYHVQGQNQDVDDAIGTATAQIWGDGVLGRAVCGSRMDLADI